MNKDLVNSNHNLYLTMSPKVEFSSGRDKFDIKEQQKKTIQMLQHYQQKSIDYSRNQNEREGILVQDSMVNSKETLTYRPGGGGGLVSKVFNTINAD